MDRFKSKFEVSDSGCWIWRAALDRHGYGEFWFDGKLRRAHRVSYELYVGPIPDGMTVDHLCFTPACVNPSHMQIVTMPANSRRQRSALKEVCVNGHPYDHTNTYYRPNGQRDCRACIRERVDRYRKKARVA